MSFDPFLMGIVTAMSVSLLVLFIYTSYRFRKHLKEFKMFRQDYQRDMEYFNRQIDSKFEAVSRRSQTNRDLSEGNIVELRRILENKIGELEKTVQNLKTSEKLYS